MKKKRGKSPPRSQVLTQGGFDTTLRVTQPPFVPVLSTTPSPRGAAPKAPHDYI